MSGKHLLEAMSYIDERFIDEAENQSIQKAPSLHWIRWVSVAACACFTAFCLYTFDWVHSPTPPVVTGPSETAETTPPSTAHFWGNTDASVQGEPTGAAYSYGLHSIAVVVRVDTLTEYGFDGTVMEDGELDAGTMLRLGLDYEHNLCEGDLVTVFILEYSDETNSAYVQKYQPIESPEN